MDCWRCQAAVTPILGHVWHPLVVCADWMPAGVDGVGGTFVSRFEQSAETHPSRMRRSPPALSDTVSLCGRAGGLRRTVRNPLRSDRFLPICRPACHLKNRVGNSDQLSNYGLCATVSASSPACSLDCSDQGRKRLSLTGRQVYSSCICITWSVNRCRSKFRLSDEINSNCRH